MRASSANRWRTPSSCAQFSASTLIATCASSASSTASHTSANAPLPSTRSVRYRPMYSGIRPPFRQGIARPCPRQDRMLADVTPGPADGGGVGEVSRAVRVRADQVDAHFDAGTPLTIGRDPASTILVDHPLVSRRHATLRADGHGWVLQDEGSRNGVFINGTRISAVTIDRPTTVHLGDAQSGPVVEIEPTTAPTGPPSAPTPAPVAPEVAVVSPGELSVIHQPTTTKVRIG